MHLNKPPTRLKLELTTQQLLLVLDILNTWKDFEDEQPRVKRSLAQICDKLRLQGNAQLYPHVTIVKEKIVDYGEP